MRRTLYHMTSRNNFIVQLTSMPVENPEWSKTRDVPMIVDSRNTVYVETDGFDLYYGMPKLNGTP